MKRIFLCVLFCSIFAGQSYSETNLKVMSYNMLFEHNVPAQVERQWVSRCPNLVAAINAMKPDIIGEQELLSWQVKDICTGTGYARIGSTLAGNYSDSDDHENEAIFYNKEKLECLESGGFWFNGHPLRPGPAKGTTYNRMCVWGHFRVIETGETFYLFNSHFYYETSVYRDECGAVLAEMVKKIPAKGEPVLLTGDFNSDVDEAGIQKVMACGYKDSRALVEAPKGPAGSYYDFKLDAAPTRILDHILVNSKVAVKDYEIVDSQIKSGKIESDHLPVIANVVLNPREEAKAASNVKYMDATDLTMIGRAFTDNTNPYHRVDTLRYTGFASYVNKLLRCSAGMAVMFKTDSKTIHVKYSNGFIYGGTSTPLLSSKGFDLYIMKDGEWTWAGCGVSSKPDGENDVVVVKTMPEGVKECLMYFPLYSEVLSCKVGVDSGATLEPLESPFRHRICFYGSSFTQGVGTSRSSMSYPMQFMRRTGLQVLNMSTSGNCLMQPEVQKILADVDADAFVFDTFSNPGSTIIKERLKTFIDNMIAAHPGVPLIFQESIWEPTRNFDTEVDAWNARKIATSNKMMEEQFIGKPGYENVYFIHPKPYTKLYDSYTDGIHPDDYSYYLWEQSVEKKILSILKKYDIR